MDRAKSRRLEAQAGVQVDARRRVCGRSSSGSAN